ncbi:hypothetical protein LJ753_07275 [Arthrobacter sp. zg-Y20]|uniref:hypothetical protein n=1 Tax=unclassified Arthrobacter TaxID=235627 RepID=UPI001D146716|nr:MULTISPECIES: hypothetical protein [unclassified Arthrobacter]MCC3275671.1 hypothetical protein [Arthrobacter sp. zg-Y20]MDK1315828.1 hypothetical protein [Arthrobacter sp. zg.Y20]WIB05113.1 hypothetical protein QNO06_11250 [Arthrobacter sp. zg-Y20]WIB06696.1 hypothetical protein QNO06_02860 [Arthrobacter sp. zg-Y20]
MAAKPTKKQSFSGAPFTGPAGKTPAFCWAGTAVDTLSRASDKENRELRKTPEWNKMENLAAKKKRKTLFSRVFSDCVCCLRTQ